ncbi:PF14238 domain protein [Bacteriovorax sp. BSW11_IV]|uniref:DUF4340 domain-containing protein n=1 Tax=Bacteriovorax sp. BSW11_IV TaxID=1353529 RepID=UPI00038A06EB|nr:DUF4340 domain-containing protein [Bacteriovorax sp. BSW11_IV]EQC48638.1 PF14238 domain protein [Bacteriovorax sp. BSW11_IV]
MKLKTLLIFTSILFVTSLFVYMNENKRGTDLLAGSDYIKGLDVNKIQKISLSFGDNKKITLTRDLNRFVLENYKSYPASVSKVNDLIYKIASIQVREKVSSDVSKDDLINYELSDDKRKYLVELFDNDGKKTISFVVGKSHKGKGNYLFREGKNEIYLSEESLWLNSSYKDFINTVLLEVKEEDIEKLWLTSDKKLEIVKKDKEFVFEGPLDNKFKKEKAQKFAKSFSSIQFDDFYSLAEPMVQTLNFNKDIKIKLKNKLIYKISFAKEKEDHFVKLTALLDEEPRSFIIRQDDSKQELQMIEDVIKAQTEAQRINREKGPWVYKISKSVYENLAKDSTFFL